MRHATTLCTFLFANWQRIRGPYPFRWRSAAQTSLETQSFLRIRSSDDALNLRPLGACATAGRVAVTRLGDLAAAREGSLITLDEPGSTFVVGHAKVQSQSRDTVGVPKRRYAEPSRKYQRHEITPSNLDLQSVKASVPHASKCHNCQNQC